MRVSYILLLSLLYLALADSSPSAESSECVEHIRKILTPDYLSSLWNMVSMTGKGINQLGDYQSCQNEPELQYTTLNVKIKEAGFVVARIGMCSPRSCNNDESFAKVSKMLKDIAEQNPELKGATIEVFVEVPEEVNAMSLSTGAWIVISILIFIVILWILGIVVQYTSIGDLPSVQAGREVSPKIEERKSKLALVFYSFNPIVNLQKLFTVKEGGDQRLAVLNGVRVLSIGWVIVGHAFGFNQMAPVENQSTVNQIFQNDLFGIVPGGFYAVDSFFYLSGFLTFALLTAKMYPKKGKVNFGLIYFHRYYRLIFPIVFITLIAMYLVKYLGSGPIYRNGWDVFTKSCEKYWWTNFLFINNLHPWNMGQECIGWVWYLANDFQFFLLSPPIIYLYCKKRIVGYVVPLLLILASMLTNAIVTAVNHLSVTLSGDADGMTLLYSKPWGRMGAYFVGAVMGLTYFELAMHEKHPELKNTLSNKIYSKLENSRLLSMVVAAIGIGITALYVFPLRNYYIECDQGANCWSNAVSTLYNMTSRPFFVFGFGIVLMPTFVGRLGMIKSFLSSEIFTVLARLNYMVYMIHCLVILWYLNDVRQASYMTALTQWMLSIGYTVVSFIFAIPCTLLFEVPFMNIEKNVLFPQKPSGKRSSIKESSPNQVEGASKNGVKYYPLSDENDKTIDTKRKLLSDS